MALADRLSGAGRALVALLASAARAAMALGAWALTPRVPTLDTDELLAGADASGAPRRSPNDARPLQLVDVRADRESAVSMIPGAITAAAYERDPHAWAGQRIVPYCTVGFRSARYTRRLLRRGVDAVNFHGSIMGWVAAGGPLVTPQGEATRRVHTWSRRIRPPRGYQQVYD